jgi:hypothetical protein
MSGLYLNNYLTSIYAPLPQNKHRLSPGDGLKGLKSRPIWL